MNGKEALKRPRRDLNSQPPDRQSGDGEFQPVSLPQVMNDTTVIGPSVGPKILKVVSESKPEPAVIRARKRRTEAAVETINGATDAAMQGDFTAALMIIATLPLSDAEKAEAVRRLLSSEERDESS